MLIRKNTMSYTLKIHSFLGCFFPDSEISRRNMFGSAPEIGHKEIFLITLVETIINVFS